MNLKDSATPGQSGTLQSVIDTNLIKGASVAEVLWALKSVASHHSFRSCDGVSDLFAKMFPNSNVAKQFSMAQTKLSYVICYGLAPCYKNEISLSPSSCIKLHFFVFDKAFNSVSNLKQLDVHVSYFDNQRNLVCQRYFDSQFLGHVTAQDQLASFKAIFKNLSYVNHLIQVSMDGPNVNWAFLDLLQEDIKTINPEAPTLL